MERPPFLDVARRVFESRHPNAIFAFVAGSIVRGEATENSDIDLVVVYPSLPNAYRESFFAEGWPIESFVHDRGTLEYFFEEVDRRSGRPSLARMIEEGIVLPEASDESTEVKGRALALIEKGPPAFTGEEIKSRRYAIIDAIDDLRSPRNREECIATLAQLHAPLADFALRIRGKWAGSGKAIPRALRAYHAAFEREFSHAFETAFANGESEPVIRLAERVLAPAGGFHFGGDRRDAPAEWRTDA